MTVLTKIVNCGNHPDDLVRVTLGNNLVRDLAHKEAMSIMGDREVFIETLNHGSGEECLHHDVMAVVREGQGDEIVRTSFNPSGSSSVDRIKTLASAMINELSAECRKGEPSTTQMRLEAIAITEIEGAAQWAVKALTTPKLGGRKS